MAIGFALYFIIDLVERKTLPWKLDGVRQDLRV